MLQTHRVARGGFSLVEAAVATAIIGVGVVALMAAVGAGTRANGAATDITKAVFLAQEIREWTLRLPFVDPDPGQADNPPGPDGSSPQTFVDDLDDLMGVTYSPPRDGRGQPISEMAEWAQKITLTWQDPNNLDANVAAGDSNVIRVQVQVLLRNREILKTGWLVARRTGP